MHHDGNGQCTMQIKKNPSDLSQDLVVKSLAAVLKPADRGIPKRAEVQSADIQG